MFNAAVKETENEVSNGGILPTDDEMDVLIDNDYVTEADFSNPAPIYGVSGLYSPTPELTRTDDAVGMTFSINRNTGEIASDFNDVFPWNKTEIVFDDENNKFVSFPEMYFRVGADENHRLTDIAVSEHPAAEGTWYRAAPFMYGCYGGSITDGKLKSVPDIIRANCKTRDDFRTAAALNGGGYHQLDLYHHTVLTFLWYIEFATKNEQSIMTGRIYDSGKRGGCSMCKTGGADSIKTPSGYETEYGQMRYHYIEDFIGNLFEYVDGVVGGNEGEHDYVTDDIKRFSDNTENKNPLVYNVPPCGYVTALGWDSDNPFMCLPAESDEDADDEYFCTYSDSADSSCPVLYCGAHYDNAYANYGLSYFYRGIAGDSNANRGGRLLKS